VSEGCSRLAFHEKAPAGFFESHLLPFPLREPARILAKMQQSHQSVAFLQGFFDANRGQESESEARRQNGCVGTSTSTSARTIPKA
jgi:hypothetical protein